MTRRSLTVVSAYVLLLALLVLTMLPVAATAATYQPYPPMATGASTGSISGRITNTGGTGISGASVIIVNAADVSVLYAGAKTDSAGNYIFTGVNSTGGAQAYRIYANATGYSDAYSSPVIVEPGNTCNVLTVILGGSGPTPTPTPTPTPRPGNVSGYITVAGSGGGLSNAKVTLVNALDAFTVYTSVYTDNNGHYRFRDVGVMPSPGYRVHVEKDGYLEQYSAHFLMTQEAAVVVNMSLSKAPDKGPVLNVTTTATIGSPSPRNVTPTPSIQPSATPAQQAAGLPGMPGFEVAAAIAGIAIASSAVGKRR